ncbi:MAG: amidohydrolase family protein, partial [Methanoregulaceae archaeon]|nr:amidohydrolase family protein [Methanoregulaceae archaeon]
MGAAHDLVLRDVLCPGGRIADISIRDGVISHVGSSPGGSDEIRCNGMIVIPAGVDMHVHMRDGNQRAKEDWKSGSMSAIAGGVTVVVDQPNTQPPLENGRLLDSRINLAREESLCSFSINGAVTPASDIGGLWLSGAMAFGEIFAAPSSYGDALPSTTLAEALETIGSLGSMATIHAEEPVAGCPEPEDLVSHDRSRPPEGEARAVRRVTGLNRTGCRLHFCHLSTAGA